MKRFTKIGILIILMLVLATPVLAEELSIVTLDLPPYGHITNGKSGGLCFELGNAIAETAGYVPNNTIAPLARAVRDIGEGEADLVIMLPNPNIEKTAQSLGIVFSMGTVILGRADSVFRNLRDTRGKRFATVRGAQYDSRVTKQNGMVLIATDNYAQSLKMLLSKRVDGVVGPLLGLTHAIKLGKFPKQAFGTPLNLSEAPATLYLSKKAATEAKQKRLTKAMSRLSKSGAIQVLLEKYSL